MIDAVSLVVRGLVLVAGCTLFAAGVLSLFVGCGDGRVMKKKRQGKKQDKKSHHQCDVCGAAYCRFEQQVECARLELAALVDGRQYECPDRVADYWERLNAA